MLVLCAALFLITAVCSLSPKLVETAIPSQLERFYTSSDYVYAKFTDGSVYTAKTTAPNWSKASIPTVMMMGMHDHDESISFYFTLNGEIYYSQNGAASVDRISTPAPFNTLGIQIFDFHPTEKEWLVFVGQDCSNEKCVSKAHYSKNQGQSWSEIDTNVEKCLWSLDVYFNPSNVPKDAIYCLTYKDKTQSIDQLRASREPTQLVMYTTGRKQVLVENVIQFYVVESVLFVATLKSKVEMLVSLDGQTFTNAVFPPNEHIEPSFYLLSSKATRIALGMLNTVKQPDLSFANIFISNSNATFYSESIENIRLVNSKVDIIQLPGDLAGIMFANQVQNVPQLLVGAEPVVATMVSLDYGATWTRIKAPPLDSNGKKFDCTTCYLNLKLYSADDYSRHFSNGILVALGNVGPSLSKDLDLWVSKNGGLDWSELKKKPAEFVLVNSLILTVQSNSVEYYDGTRWNKLTVSLDEMKIFNMVTDSKSLQDSVTIAGYLKNGDKITTKLVGIEFGMSECSESDYVEYNIGCLLGSKTSFKRIQDGHLCKFHEFNPSKLPCECTEKDFECDYGFWRNGTSCSLLDRDPQQPLDCQGGSTYTGSSGFRKVSLSQCTGGVDLTGKIERKCNEFKPATGQVYVSVSEFDDSLSDYYYFNSSSTILVKTASGTIYMSTSSGKQWNPLGIEQFLGIARDNPHDRVFLVTRSGLILVESNGSIKQIPVDIPPNTLGSSIIACHQTDPNQLLWTGQRCTDTQCSTETLYTDNLGSKWQKILDNSRDCLFKGNLIYCKSKQSLVYSADNGKSWKQLIKSGVVGFTLYHNFILVAATLKDKVELLIGMDDPQKLVNAEFPGFSTLEHGYTVLSSAAGSLFIDMYVNTEKKNEIGALFKSNSNGITFSLVLSNTNRDVNGYVDFEKISGFDNVAIANIVQNAKQVQNFKEKKRIQTRISFDDGFSWQSLNASSCSEADCTLHLHAYTERHDLRDTFSASSAPGILVAVGNTGKQLLPFNQGDVFLTRNAGKTWSKVLKEGHMIEIGNYGNIIVLVNDEGPTDEIVYTLDQGNEFKKIKLAFSIRVSNIITQDSYSTARFLVFGTSTSTRKPVGIYLDFDHVFVRQCTDDDFETWQFGSCVFGRQLEFKRRKQSSMCMVATGFEPKVLSKCECALSDFECDYGFHRVNDTCVAIGKAPTCGTSGYIKSVKSFCEGGLALDSGFSSCHSYSWLGWLFGAVFIAFIAFKYSKSEKSVSLGDTSSNDGRFIQSIKSVAGYVGELVGAVIHSVVGIFNRIKSKLVPNSYQPLSTENLGELQGTAFWGVE